MNSLKFIRLIVSGNLLAGFCLLPLASRVLAQTQAQSAPAKKGAPREVVAEEDLRKTMLESKKLSGPLLSSSLKTEPVPLTGPRPSTDNTLYARSIILYDGNEHTVVPLGSILCLPVEFQGCIVAQPTGKFTGWPKFLARNAAWLETHEVTLTMAKGDPAEAQKVLNSVKNGVKVLVSVYKGGPVSLLEPVSPAHTAPLATKPPAGNSSTR